MSSPKLEVLFVFNATTGLPQAGLTLTFSTYKDDQGNNLTQPTITEIGGGAYKFTPVFSDATKGIVYIVATGANPAYLMRYMRPEDWNADNADVASSTLATASSLTTASSTISSVLKWVSADEELVTSGGDAGRKVYRDSSDHSTVLGKFDLLESDGVTKDSTGTITFHKRKV